MDAFFLLFNVWLIRRHNAISDSLLLEKDMKEGEIGEQVKQISDALWCSKILNGFKCWRAPLIKTLSGNHENCLKLTV